MAKKALDFAHWFVQNLKLSRSWPDQSKLQKLLFFSWLIHFVNYQTPLFEDDFYAFKRGPVVWDVLYLSNLKYTGFLTLPLPNFSPGETDTLRLTCEMFGNACDDELIELSQKSPIWERHYNESKIYENGKFTGEYDRKKQMMPKDEFETELRVMKDLLDVHKH
ncbi:MAG: SocA family protein [Methanosarcinales archaeon]|jgi:hypothetical protein|nr:SocA family protein [Methanosarcinales archaeon]